MSSRCGLKPTIFFEGNYGTVTASLKPVTEVKSSACKVIIWVAELHVWIAISAP